MCAANLSSLCACLFRNMSVPGESRPRIAVDKNLDMFSEPTILRSYIKKEEVVVSVRVRIRYILEFAV